MPIADSIQHSAASIAVQNWSLWQRWSCSVAMGDSFMIAAAQFGLLWSGASGALELEVMYLTAAIEHVAFQVSH